MTEEQIAVVRRGCTRTLTAHLPRGPKAVFSELAERTPPELDPDKYGAGEVTAAFEREVAALLGKEAAVFMPTGIMAQTIAMRLWSVERGLPAIAYHPTSHLAIHEHHADAFVHGMRPVHLGTAERLFERADLANVKDRLGAVLVELPQREIGGQLPAWDDLAAVCADARERGAGVHLDGARLWECGPFYGRPYAEIAGLFDTVYVSFYKAIGAIAGAMLAGPKAFIDAARIWQRRLGGNVISLYPYVLSARFGLAEQLPRIPSYVEKAGRLAERLCAIPGIFVVPERPPTNMMHLFLCGDRELLMQRALALSERTSIWMFDALARTVIPGMQKREVSVGEGTLQVDDAEFVAMFEELVRVT